MTLAGELWKLPSWFGYARWVGAAVLLLVVAGSVLITLWQIAGRSRTSGMVVGIVGRMGSGKSYAGVRMAIDRLKRGVDVASNFYIDVEGLGVTGTWRPFTGWDMFAELHDCVVIVDEAHLYAASHQHINFPMLARWALSQARHRKLDLYWISQHEDRVNKTLRDLTNEIRVCEAFFGGKLFRVVAYAPEDLRKAKKHLWKRWYRLDRKIADRYDTHTTVEVDEYSLKGDSSASRLRKVQAAAVGRERGSATAGPDVGGPAVPSWLTQPSGS